jgi:hypothetical protein
VVAQTSSGIVVSHSIAPKAEMTAADCGGGFLGSTCRRADAADRRWLRRPDAGQQLASLASAIEASPSMRVAKLDGAD